MNEQQRAARKELVSLSTLAVASLVVLLLSFRGAFASAIYFPHVFAGILVLVAILSWRVAPRALAKPRLVATVVLLSAALTAPVVHRGGMERSRLAREQAGIEALVGRAAPAIAPLATLPAGREDAAAFAGRTTLVNFWADWCAPCVAELPELAEFAADQRDAGIDVVGVTQLSEVDSPGAERRERLELLARFLDERGVDYPVLVEGSAGAAHRAYLVRSLPTTVLVDATGAVVDYGAGVSGTRRLMERARALSRSGEPGTP